MILLLATLCFTNLTGHVISAESVKVDGDVAVFAKAGSASEAKVPLKVFPANEQQRIKAAAGIREMPAELKGVARVFAEQREHAEQRAAAGRMKPEELADKRGKIAAAWKIAVERSNLNEGEKTYWKGRCP